MEAAPCLPPAIPWLQGGQRLLLSVAPSVCLGARRADGENLGCGVPGGLLPPGLRGPVRVQTPKRVQSPGGSVHRVSWARKRRCVPLVVFRDSLSAPAWEWQRISVSGREPRGSAPWAPSVWGRFTLLFQRWQGSAAARAERRFGRDLKGQC